MKRPVEVLRGARSAFAGYSERTILIGTILLATAISAVTGFVLTQYFSIDALSSLVFIPDDCAQDWGMNVGRHCFSDYTWPVTFGMRANPWAPYPIYTHTGFKMAYDNYPAAGILPQTMFGLLGKWLGAKQLGLFCYLLVLTIACLSPAVWAARGAHGLERVVVFVACGAAAIPAWMTIDRGNSVGFVVPVALVFLVALSRQRWGLVTIMVILAALLKPQFAVIGVALFAARQWRYGGIAVGGVVLSNLAAYALWPRDFPETIMQSIHNTFGYNSFQALLIHFNVSFAKGLLLLPDGIKARQTGGKIPDGFLGGPRLLIGYAVLVLAVVAVLALGRRIPPVMVGIVLLAAAALFPAVSLSYYLVFVLPIAALVARDPDGPPGTGIFDRPAVVGGRRRAVGVCVSLASALSIAQIALPSPPIHADLSGQLQMGGAKVVDRAVVLTTVQLAPILWLITCAAIIVSYARRREPPPDGDGDVDSLEGPAGEEPPDAATSDPSPPEPEEETELSPQLPA